MNKIGLLVKNNVVSEHSVWRDAISANQVVTADVLERFFEPRDCAMGLPLVVRTCRCRIGLW